jgi:hypothetical protein
LTYLLLSVGDLKVSPSWISRTNDPHATAQAPSEGDPVKVSITGEAEMIEALAHERDDRIKVESVSPAGEDTEQQFGLVEVATVIAIVQGVQELAGVIVKFWRARRSPRRQSLRIKTASGVVTFELDYDADLETVRGLLEPLFTL